MTISEFTFDTKQEIDSFIQDKFKSNPKTTLDEILSTASHKKFATQDLREYFIEVGKRALAQAF
jgi:hypothetical protein